MIIAINPQSTTINVLVIINLVAGTETLFGRLFISIKIFNDI